MGLGAMLHGLLQAEVGHATPKPCSQCSIQRVLAVLVIVPPGTPAPGCQCR